MNGCLLIGYLRHPLGYVLVFFQACRQFIKQSPDGFMVAIVKFSSFASLEFNLTTLNEQTKRDAIAAIPRTTGGGTGIGKGKGGSVSKQSPYQGEGDQSLDNDHISGGCQSVNNDHIGGGGGEGGQSLDNDHISGGGGSVSKELPYSGGGGSL